MDKEEKQLLTDLTLMGCKAIDGKYTDKHCEGKDGDYLFDSIHNVNFKPHPFMIGVPLVAHASDYYGGMLGIAAIQDFEERHGYSCAFKDKKTMKCLVPYVEHTSDKVAFLKVKSERELNENKELPKFLYACKPTLEEKKIDGIAFVKWR